MGLHARIGQELLTATSVTSAMRAVYEGHATEGTAMSPIGMLTGWHPLQRAEPIQNMRGEHCNLSWYNDWNASRWELKYDSSISKSTWSNRTHCQPTN